MIKQKRRFARVQWLIPCRYQSANREKGHEIHGWSIIRYISVHGAEMATRFPVKRHQKIFLTFKIGKKNQFENLPATILSVTQEGIYKQCGLSFDSVDDPTRMDKAIRALLSEQLEEV